MSKDFVTTVCGNIAVDPTTNAVTLTLKGVPQADLAAFLAWLSDWIPVCDPGSMPAVARAAMARPAAAGK